MERIIDVAHFIIGEYQRISGQKIDEMKLHLLLYFAQRESFAISGHALFEGDLAAWKNGPVSMAVKTKFEEDGIEAQIYKVGSNSAYILKNVVMGYGQFTDWKLRAMIRREVSWCNARKGLLPNEEGNKVLCLNDIQMDAEKVRPFDHLWGMYYDEFDNFRCKDSEI